MPKVNKSARQPDDLPRHSIDFRRVWWPPAGPFSFTAEQAAIVALLWLAWLNRTPELAELTLRSRVELLESKAVARSPQKAVSLSRESGA